MTTKSRHGHTSGGTTSPTYRVWVGIKRRCTNHNYPDFHRYGGRGITFCQRWESFDNFLSDMGEAPRGKSIDRIDNDGNYEPSNCRWATTLEQVHNSSATKWYEFNGERLPLSEWAKRIGINLATLRFRVNHKKQPIEQALTNPLRYKR